MIDTSKYEEYANLTHPQIMKQCKVCGKWALPRYMYNTNGVAVCNNCYTGKVVCNMCRQITDFEQTIQSKYGRICQECYGAIIQY
jgi:formylmethanofuran dehydrogenase subunit E